MASIWDELRRRNVVRVAIAYAVVSWLVLQLTDVMMPILNLPEWVDGLIFWLLAIGFILAIFFSWVYEVTPEGIKRETDVDRSASITHETGRKLNVAIVGLLALAVSIFAFDTFVGPGAPPEIEAEPVAAGHDGPIRIAVLPFVNMSDDSDQEYFSDGLSEELLNLLARIPELRVTSRTSAFSFKDQNFTIAEVGERLSVDHVLEGSVRRSGDTVRITAQLIHVVTDEHEWSETWDRKFEDIFVIQDEIAAQVVDALKLELLDAIPTIEETTPEVYALVLEASYMARQFNAPGFRRAVALLEQAIEIDPSYSPAWSQLGWALYGGSSSGVSERVDVMPRIREAIDQSLSLNPSNVSAHLLRAQIAINYDYDIEQATRALEVAGELEPWNAQAHMVAFRLAYVTGDLEKAVDHIEIAHELDPLAAYRQSTAYTYYLTGRVESAMKYFEEFAESRPFADRSYAYWARAVLLDGDPEGALALLDNEASDGHRITGRALVFQSLGETGKAREELEKLLALGNRWTFEVAEVYANLGDADEAFTWLERAIERRDASLNQTVIDPFIEPIRNDPRFDELLERLDRKPAL
jgi:TolB-like protein/Tfp pilus assembly protein PilF